MPKLAQLLKPPWSRERKKNHLATRGISNVSESCNRYSNTIFLDSSIYISNWQVVVWLRRIACYIFVPIIFLLVYQFLNLFINRLFLKREKKTHLKKIERENLRLKQCRLSSRNDISISEWYSLSNTIYFAVREERKIWLLFPPLFRIGFDTRGKVEWNKRFAAMCGELSFTFQCDVTRTQKAGWTFARSGVEIDTIREPKREREN